MLLLLTVFLDWIRVISESCDCVPVSTRASHPSTRFPLSPGASSLVSLLLSHLCHSPERTRGIVVRHSHPPSKPAARSRGARASLRLDSALPPLNVRSLLDLWWFFTFTFYHVSFLQIGFVLYSQHVYTCWCVSYCKLRVNEVLWCCSHTCSWASLRSVVGSHVFFFHDVSPWHVTDHKWLTQWPHRDSQYCSCPFSSLAPFIHVLVIQTPCIRHHNRLNNTRCLLYVPQASLRCVQISQGCCIRKMTRYLAWLGATWFIWLYWAPWQIMAIPASSPNHDGDSQLPQFSIAFAQVHANRLPSLEQLLLVLSPSRNISSSGTN